MIRYLNWEEKQRSRGLWEEAFPEETAGYNDFYYRVKMRGNRVLALVCEGEAGTMLHRNPYRVAVRDRVWEADYIVGVATAIKKRRRGYMRRLLCRALEDMYAERKPFCYLMPADETLYSPFQFAWIYDRLDWTLETGREPETEREVETRKKAETERQLNCVLVGAGDQAGLERAKAFVKGWLESHYQVYCVRDGRYWGEFLEELGSEAGEVYLVYDVTEGETKEKLVGVKCDWGLEEKEQRALYALDEYTRPARPALPGIMARIVDLEEFIKVIRLRAECIWPELTVRLTVRDPLLPGNDGSFIWYLDHEGARVWRTEPAGAFEREELSLSVEELTQWLFGYKEMAGFPSWCAWIETLRKPYFDELV